MVCFTLVGVLPQLRHRLRGIECQLPVLPAPGVNNTDMATLKNMYNWLMLVAQVITTAPLTIVQSEKN